MANKMKTLYDQGKALMTPEDNEAEAMKQKNANVDEYANAQKPTLVIAAPKAETSPYEKVGMGAYGSRPGEKRIDTSFPSEPSAVFAPPVPDPKVPVQNQMKAEGQEAEDNDEAERQATDQNMRNMQQQQMMNAPVAFHAEGGELDKDKINIVGENGPEEIVGDEVIPLDHTMPKGRSTAPEEEQEGAPADFSGPVFENPTHVKAKWDTEKPEIEQQAPMNNDNYKGGEQAGGNPAQVQEMSNKPSPSHPKVDIPQPVTKPTQADADAYVQGLPGTATPEERKASITTPNDGMMKSKQLQGMDDASAAARKDQLAQPTPPAPDPNQILADQHAKVMKAKLDAASKGDMVGLGSAIIAGQTLNTAAPQATTAAESGQAPTAEQANLAPGATATPAYTGKERIGAGTPGEAQAQQDYKAKIADLDHRILTASQIHTPEGKQELGYLQSEKSVLQKMNPLGSAANKPGVLGKIEHGLGEVGNVVGNAALGERNMATIPGSAAGLEKANEEGAANVEQGEKGALNAATVDAKKSAATAAANDPKLAGQLLQKGYTIEKDAQGNITGLKQVEGFENGPKDLKENLAKAVSEAQAKGENPLENDKVKQIQQLMATTAKQQQPSSEANKERAQATVAKLHGAGLPVGPDKLNASIEQGIRSGAISQEEGDALAGFQGINTTPAVKLDVANSTGEAKDARKNANTTYTYKDADGKTKMAKGSEIPDDVTERTPIKDPAAFINEARQADIIQKSLNHLNKTDLGIFDNPDARAVLSVALADTGQMGIGAGPVQVRPPEALENQAKKLMVNSGTGLDDKTRQKVKDYIVDYWAAKDKLMLVQQQIQNGKMGRGTKSFFDAMLSQLPGAQTADKGQAVRQLNDFKETVDTLRDKYPDQFGSYKKESAAEVNAPSAGNAQYHYDSPKGPIFSNDGKTWYDDKGQKIGK